MSEFVLQGEFGKVLLFLNFSHGYNGSRVHHSCQIPLQSEQVPLRLVTSFLLQKSSLFPKPHTTVQSGAHYLEFISNAAFSSRNEPIGLPESGHMTEILAMADQAGIHDADTDVFGDQDEEEKSEPSTCVRKLTGLVLIVLSIILYFYTLYILISVLVYPGSISSLLSASPPPSRDENETSGKGCLHSLLQTLNLCQQTVAIQFWCTYVKLEWPSCFVTLQAAYFSKYCKF